MDASYEVLGHDSNSEGTMSGEELEEEVNGEEVRQQMEAFKMSQFIRTAVAGLGFAMSVVGIVSLTDRLFEGLPMPWLP